MNVCVCVCVCVLALEPCTVCYAAPVFCTLCGPKSASKKVYVAEYSSLHFSNVFPGTTQLS